MWSRSNYIACTAYIQKDFFFLTYRNVQEWKSEMIHKEYSFYSHCLAATMIDDWKYWVVSYCLCTRQPNADEIRLDHHLQQCVMSVILIHANLQNKQVNMGKVILNYYLNNKVSRNTYSFWCKGKSSSVSVSLGYSAKSEWFRSLSEGVGYESVGLSHDWIYWW